MATKYTLSLIEYCLPHPHALEDTNHKNIFSTDVNMLFKTRPLVVELLHTHLSPLSSKERVTYSIFC